MGKLVDLGFRFSIDKVTSAEIDLPDLERSGVRYAKIPARMLSEQIVHGGVRPRSAITREIAAADIAAVFQRYGVDLIAERIESEDAVLEVLDLDVPYAPRPPVRRAARDQRKPDGRDRPATGLLYEATAGRGLTRQSAIGSRQSFCGAALAFTHSPFRYCRLPK